MNPGAAGTVSDRVLVLLPTVRDAERTALLFQEGGVSSTVCFDLNMLCRELRSGAGAVLLADEAMAGDAVGQLAEAMREQPPWSAVPVVVLAREGATQRIERSSADWLRSLIVVERPVRTRTLLSVILSALRGRSHQYQIRDALLLREQQANELRGQEERLRSALLALQTSQAELARQAEQLRTSSETRSLRSRQG